MEVAFLWSSSPGRSTGRSSWKNLKANSRPSLGADGDVVGSATENRSVAALILVTASAGLVASGHAARRLRMARKAQGRLIRPPLPPYLEPDSNLQSEALVRQDPQDAILVHPATRALEDAMTTDSLRTLCKALATASGTFSPASISSNPDRTTRPKMGTALTIRALLRYCELRHTAGDDLSPQDFLGRSGTGVRALLRMCRNHQAEVAAELEDRGDDVVRMIKAFHDQGEMVEKYLPFFRTAIEKSIPALLRQTSEPLPRVISFLEPYGEIQLSFLYEAAKDRALKARLNQFEPRHLLEVTDKWVSRARNGQLAITTAHKARVVVRHVASLDIELAPPDRAAWMGMALWGSVLETSEDLEIMEDRIRKGAFYRGDPVEMLSIAERMAEVHGLNDEMFQLVRLPLLEAMQKAGPERAAEALASLTFATGKLRVPKEKARLLLPERLRKRFKIWKIGEDPPVGKLQRRDPAPPPKPKEAFSLLLMRLMEAFTIAAPLLNLEIVLERWVAKNFHLEKCEEVTRDVMLQRLATEDNLMDPTSGEETLATAESPSILPGPLARCSSHLISLGLPAYTLAPAIDWLLSEPAGWAEKKAYSEVANPKDPAQKIEKMMLARRAATTKLAKRSLPLLSHLWPEEREGKGQDNWNLFPLRGADELLRLVGPTQERKDQRIRQADLAANQLLQRLAVQMIFPDLQAELEFVMREWRETQPETTLSTLVAPRILKAARMCADEPNGPGEEASGVLARSIGLLARTIKLEEISLLSAEWALGPFEQAEACGEAVALVSSSCAKGGVSEVILSDACSSWLEAGCKPGSLGVQLAEQSLLAWERDESQGVVHLRQAQEYLERQLALGMLSTAPRLEERLKTATESLQVLVGAIDGVAPSLAQLSRGRQGIYSKLDYTGRAALVDAVAASWSAAMPGLTVGVAAAYFEEWLQGLCNRRSLVDNAATGALQELKWNLQMKLDTTFANQRSEAYSSPSFRLEGVRKVPWFVPTSVVEEAFADKPIGLRKEALPSPGPGFVRSTMAIEQAKDKSGGRCMYCGGSWKLTPRYFWPHELGGTELVSNLCGACELCTEMAHALGPKRWGEVLFAKPEEAAEVWWEAQKKANMETVSFLNPKNGPSS